MLFRVHVREGRRILALCDDEVIGKVYREGGRVLDLNRFAGFYGERGREEDARAELARASSINAVGRRSVALVIKSGLAKESDVVFIQGVPHVQVYRL
ncbi:MAG: DUF424 family protein [Candidatus Micrarchaeia archaeon]